MGPNGTTDLALLEDRTRQSPIAIAQMVVVFLRNIGAFNVAIAAGFLISGRLPVSVLFVLPVIGVVVLVANIVAWWHFTFRATAEELVVTRGVVFRTTLTIPWGKVQSVSINESLLQRMLGLVSASVDAAGSEATEFSILGIRRDQAEALRRLASKTASASPVPLADREVPGFVDAAPGNVSPVGPAGLANLAPPDADTLTLGPDLPEAPVGHDLADRSGQAGPSGLVVGDSRAQPPQPVKLLAQRKPRELLILGALSNPFSGLAVLAAGAYWLDDAAEGLDGALGRLGLDVPEADDVSFSLTLLALLGAMLGALVLVIWLVVSIRSVIRNWDLRLTSVDDAIDLDVGLFQRRSQSSNLKKIQALTLTHGPLRRRAGYVRTELVTIGSGDIKILGLKQTELAQLRTVLGLPVEGEVTSRISNHFVKKPLRMVALAVIPVVVASFWLNWQLVPLVMIPGVVIGLRSYFFWRGFRWDVSEQTLRRKLGNVFVIETAMHRQKIQCVGLTQNWYQRRRDLASIVVSNAESALSIPMLPLAEAKRLRDQLLDPTKARSLAHQSVVVVATDGVGATTTPHSASVLLAPVPVGHPKDGPDSNGSKVDDPEGHGSQALGSQALGSQALGSQAQGSDEEAPSPSWPSTPPD